MLNATIARSANQPAEARFLQNPTCKKRHWSPTDPFISLPGSAQKFEDIASPKLLPVDCMLLNCTGEKMTCKQVVYLIFS
jgi:hypothetical protein